MGLETLSWLRPFGNVLGMTQPYKAQRVFNYHCHQREVEVSEVNQQNTSVRVKRMKRKRLFFFYVATSVQCLIFNKIQD